MLTFTKTLLLVSVVHACLGQNQFMSAVRNLNDGKNGTKDGDNALKNDFLKHVKECELDEDSSKYEDGGKPSADRGNGGTYPEFYGVSKLGKNRRGGVPDQNRNYSWNVQRKDEGFNGNRDFVSNRERTDGQNWHNRNSENSSYYRPNENQFGYDFGNFRGRMGDPNYADNQPMEGYVPIPPNNEFYGTPPRQFGNTDIVYRRMKRSDNANCINQCAFGYLDVLDDNRVPSETAVIKYLQDHVPNDRKRIQYLKETRRCFAQLATTDNEDGCGFSKMLAKCLKLETE